MLINIEKIADLALQQVDTAGYYLGRYGISQNINRHNLIALIVTEKERLQGDYSRLELRAQIRLQRLKKARAQLEDKMQTWLKSNPPLNRVAGLLQ